MFDDENGPWAIPLPPYGVPLGPTTDDGSVLCGFAAAEPVPGHSDKLHVEGEVLVVDGDVPIALRLQPDIVLARTDLPEGLEAFAARVAEALAGAGMELLDEGTLLAAPVAMQVLGLRLSSWDLWGNDLDAAFAALRAAAVGEQALPRDAADGWAW
jgi:hypothetical protein